MKNYIIRIMVSIISLVVLILGITAVFLTQKMTIIPPPLNRSLRLLSKPYILIH